MLETVVRFLSERGALAQPEALTYLAGLPDPIGALKAGLQGRPGLPPIVSLEDAQDLTGVEGAPASVRPTVEAPLVAPEPAREPRRVVPATGVAPAVPRQVAPAIAPVPVVGGQAPALEMPAPVGGAAPEPRIDADVSGISTCEGTIDDFARLFRDRFNRMRKIYRKRREMVGATSIERMSRTGQPVKFLAIVNEVRTTRKGHKLLEVEDETGSARVLAPKSDGRLVEITETILPDEIVGIIGRVTTRGPGDGGLVIMDELVRPELPVEHRPGYGHPGGALFVSDVHIGSHEFLHEQWERLLDWIAGRMPEGRELAAGVRWLIINGDIVDGVGIYPGQDKDLEVNDVMEQYKLSARMLAQVPDHIRIIISPGNHDAVRPAEPQPAFPEAIRELFPPNVTCVGNPCALNLDGVEVLAYHGVSLFDYFQALPGVDIYHPLETMREMLLRRHLCPIYGGRTPLAPEHRDYMVIERIPDVFVTGHVHAADVAQFRGVTLVNSSTWQSQTDYQRMLGFEPDPCKAFHVDLATGVPTVLDFMETPDQGHPVVEANPARRMGT